MILFTRIVLIISIHLVDLYLAFFLLCSFSCSLLWNNLLFLKYWILILMYHFECMTDPCKLTRTVKSEQGRGKPIKINSFKFNCINTNITVFPIFQIAERDHASDPNRQWRRIYSASLEFFFVAHDSCLGSTYKLCVIIISISPYVLVVKLIFSCIIHHVSQAKGYR